MENLLTALREFVERVAQQSDLSTQHAARKLVAEIDRQLVAQSRFQDALNKVRM